MRILISISFLALSTFSFAQSNIGPKDPCYTDFKSDKCLGKIRTKIFFMSSVKGDIRSEETAYVNDYVKRHGIEGFYGPDSQYHPSGSLFEYAINTSKNPKLNKKLIEAMPIGQELNGKNIFEMVISKRQSPRTADMQNYISNLNVLFPKEGNDKFQKTKEKFGLPWDDPAFAQKYMEQIQDAITVIDESNSFFHRSELLSERKQLLEIKERVEVLASMPKKACELKNIEEYRIFKQDYGDLYKSSSIDIVGCLVKGEEYALAEAIIKDGDFDMSKLPAYFDQAVALKETVETYDYSKFLFGELAKQGQKINPKKGESQRDLLQRGSQYLHKYQQEDEVICNLNFGAGSKIIDELSKDLNMILFLEGYQLMEKILSQKDPALKDKLVNQFLDLSKVGNSLGLMHPTKGNSILHLIAESGDHELYKKLEDKGVSTFLLGYKVKDANGNTPVIAAIKIGKPGNIKFALQYLKSQAAHSGDLSEMLKATKKLKSDDPEVRELKKLLKWEVKDEMWDAY
jgi:hypothetical protein